MRRILSFIIALITLSILTGCSADKEKAEATRVLVPVKIQLSWTHEYSSSPFHIAVHNGHFAEQGMDITLFEGGFNEQGYIDPIAEVLNGNADFSMSDGYSLIQARANGLPVVAIASILQRSPLAVISLAGSSIIQPKDLVGHTISVANGGALISLNTLLQSQGVDKNSVNIIERTSFGTDPLVNGEVDGIVAWIINEGVAITEQGLNPQFLLMSDYGVETYDFVLFTTETMIENNPELVQGVVNAVRKGLQDVVANPSQAIDVTLTYNSELVKEDQLNRLEATIPLINVPGQALGGMDPLVWQFTHDFLVAQNIISEPISVEDVYTLQFVSDDKD